MKNIEFQLDNLAAPTAPAHGGEHIFVPENVCAKLIRFEVEGDRLSSVSFKGGCDGNLKAIAALVKGMKLTDIIDTLSGIRCGRKNTSCGDQFTRALREYLDSK